tara:strand:+ start:625 stop:1014 length:390 start_codon:yes stop_codon:yes gene_type:complete
MNKFGVLFGKIEFPITSEVGVIEDKGINREIYRVGFLANQIGNLGMERRDTNYGDVFEMIALGEKGLADGTFYGWVDISYRDEIVRAIVYNVVPKVSRQLGREKVAISQKLASDLEIGVGDEIIINSKV